MRIAASAFALLLLSPIWLMGQATGEKTTSVEFNRDIRPILSDKCFTCHGPDQARRRTKLRFDHRKRRQAGPRRPLRHRSGRCRQERDDSADHRGRSCPANAAARLRTHADRPRDRPDPKMDRAGRQMGEPLVLCDPQARAPSRESETGHGHETRLMRSCCDRLEQEGLTPSPEADRTTLIRRVSLDLTGLPPTPAEIDAFLADSIAERVRESRRSSAGISAIRRTDGGDVARCRALCRYQRLSDRCRAVHVALAGLGHRGLQPQPAVRPVRAAADCRRHASRVRPWTRRSPPASIAIIAATARAASSPKNTRSNTSSIAWRPHPPSSWGSRWAVLDVTITSTTRFRRRSSISSSRTSTTFPNAARPTSTETRRR